MDGYLYVYFDHSNINTNISVFFFPGINSMTKGSFVKRYDAKNNSYQYVQAFGTKTKNNQDTDQDISKSGVIPFQTYKNGKNQINLMSKFR